jgi:hypothetical protein
MCKSENMKHFAFLIVALLAGPALLAQISLRPQVGLNSSTLSKDLDEVEFKEQVGYQFGLDLQIGENVYIQPGFFFEAINNKVGLVDLDEELDMTISRLRIPIMLGYKFAGPESDRILDFRLFTGPNLSFVVSRDLKDAFTFGDDDFKDIVWGWNVGAGLDIAIVFVDFGYQFGLSEVFDDLDTNAKNNLWYANAGIRLGF